MEFDFSDIRPGVFNALMILAIVTVTVPLAKAFVARYPIPGVSDLVNSI